MLFDQLSSILFVGYFVTAPFNRAQTFC